MSAISKKILSWLSPFIILPLVVPVTFFLKPRTAEAQFVPVTDVPALPVQVENAAQNTSRTTKEFGLDAIMTAVAKTLIKQISRSTIQWINSGFKGSPAFIQNPEQFFIGVADRVAGQFIEELGFGFLCEPFRLDLQLQLALEYGGGGSFTDEFECTFSDIAGNIEGFLDGDFTQGGWDGWFSVTQNRNNNPYGAYISAKTTLDIRIAGAQGTERMTLDWGDGFKSLTDGLGNILTPGATIEAQLSETLGTDLRQLELADEINEIMGALVGQLMTQVMSATGLAGASGSSYSDGYNTRSGFDSDYLDDIRGSESLYEDTLSDSQLDVDSGGFGGNETNETGVVNLALRTTASQSGTLQFNDNGYPADLAVDGSRDGNTRADFANTAGTERVNNAWWQIDLGETKAIRDISIYRVTETSIENPDMGSFKVFISNTPFICEQSAPYNCTLSGVSFDPTNPPSSVTTRSFSSMPTAIPFTVGVNATGRFVRVQRVDGVHRLQLAEVEVYRNNAPTITLNGSSRVRLERGGVYIEEGATAFDQSDADLGIAGGVVPVTTSITFNASPVLSVDTAVTGTYIVTYTAVDSGGAVGKKTRTITVVEPN